MTSNKYLTSYQRIDIPEEGIEGDDDLGLPPDPMIHIVPKSDQTRWNHIEDLDSFFTRIYQYHQESGFVCKIVKESCDIFLYVFIVGFTTFLCVGVNYAYMFQWELPPDYNKNHRVALPDIFIPFNKALQNFTPIICIYLFVAFLFLLCKIFSFVIDYFHFKEIKKFYNKALGFEDRELENITWEEIQQRLMEVQVEQRMCIHKESLTELDIYHRILRYENYFIAMINKNVIPLKLNLPFLGEVTFLTRGLRYNINCLLFHCWGVSPFKNWHLKEEYKRAENRHRLAEDLKWRLRIAGILNFLLCPFVLLLQMLHAFYYYTSLVRREPGILGLRRWSCYGEVALRHYNELDHELRARLNRGYRFAKSYMNSFSSPLTTIIANCLKYIFGSVGAVLLVLTVFDQDVLQVDHMLTILGAMLAGAHICSALIPDENMVWCPEVLMTKVLAEVHYLPDPWKDKAHTSYVRKEFSNYFQYNLVHLLESLVSPLVTWYILSFKMGNKSLEIVDFLRNFTVEVQGVGDICSFAQMDIRRHGSRTWHPRISSTESSGNEHPITLTDNGKTELSLLHFTLTNPNWKPPQDSAAFLHAIKKNARTDFRDLAIVQENAYASSSSVSLGDIGNNDFTRKWLNSHNMEESFSRRFNCMEGSRHVPSNGILGSIIPPNTAVTDMPAGLAVSQRGLERDPLINYLSPRRPQDMVAMDMSVSALYLHDFHRRRRAADNFVDNPVHGLLPQPNFQPSATYMQAGDTVGIPQHNIHLLTQLNYQPPPTFNELDDDPAGLLTQLKFQPPAIFGGLPTSISESCYNSSNPPSMGESMMDPHAQHSLARLYDLPQPPHNLNLQPTNTSYTSGSSQHPSDVQWNPENAPPSNT